MPKNGDQASDEPEPTGWRSVARDPAGERPSIDPHEISEPLYRNAGKPFTELRYDEAHVTIDANHVFVDRVADDVPHLLHQQEARVDGLERRRLAGVVQELTETPEGLVERDDLFLAQVVRSQGRPQLP